MDSLLTALDNFYSEIVQHIKPWAPAPPKIRDSEALTPDEVVAEDDILAGAGDRPSEDLAQQLATDSLATAF